MRDFVRRHWAHVTGWAVVISLVTALGVADALPGRNTVTSDDIVNGQVTSADIKNRDVRSADLRSGAVTAAKIKDNAVTSGKVANGSLTGSDVANNSLKGADIDEGSLKFGCSQPGLSKAWAFVNGDPNMPTTGTTSATYLLDHFNCTGNAVEVARTQLGEYVVTFTGLGAPRAGFGLVYDLDSEDCWGASVTYSWFGFLPESYYVIIRSNDGAAIDCDFSFGVM